MSTPYVAIKHFLLTSIRQGARAGNDIGRFARPTRPQYYHSGPPPFYKMAPGTAARGPKILSNLTPISMSTPYVAIKHHLLTSIRQEKGKLADSLAARAIEVGFFKHAWKCAGPQNWIRSHQELIQRYHSYAMYQSMESLSPLHKE